ncbi:tetratricopeptide repeat protein, partial [Escherichia coli]
SGICICALYAAILANVHLQRHQDAVILIDKILTYNPENNQGTRWLLGAELLRAGKHGRALYVLTGHVNEFPPYWYELALLHFMNEAYINAATAFRYGFLTSIYC